MSTLLNFARDVQGLNTFAPYISQDNYSGTIASGAAQSITIPSNGQQWIAVLNYQFGSDIWVAVNHTAAQPAGATFASSNSILTPAQLRVNAGNTISCYNNSATAQDVSISLYAIA